MAKSKRGRVYNSFFDEGKWKLVHPENKSIMEDYLLELKQRQMKDSTIKQYRNDWRILFIVIYDMFGNKSALELSKKDFRRISLFFKENKDMSNARVNRLMSATRSLLSYVEDDDDYDYDLNAAGKVKGLPKEPVRDIVFLTNEQIFQIKDILMEKEEYQKLVLLFLAYDSAGRKNELAQVKKAGFYDETISITNQVIGKRGKKFNLVYFSETKNAVRLYLEQRGEDDIDSLWILGKEENKREADSDNLYEWIIQINKMYIEKYGVDLGFNVHSLRHSSLENMSEGVATHYVCGEVGKPNGFNLTELQMHANHSDVSTTQSYLIDKTDEQKLTMFGIDPNKNNL